MGRRTGYTPGTPSWVDLTTTDVVGRIGGVTVPSGRFAVAVDPQGAVFCLVEGEFDA